MELSAVGGVENTESDINRIIGRLEKVLSISQDSVSVLYGISNRAWGSVEQLGPTEESPQTHMGSVGEVYELIDSIERTVDYAKDLSNSLKGLV